VISCVRFDELHRLTLDAPLSGVNRSEFDAHLGSCRVCVSRVRGYVGTLEALQAVGVLEDASEGLPYAALPEALVQRILAARRADGGDAREKRQG
jgi:hypothetical protein